MHQGWRPHFLTTVTPPFFFMGSRWKDVDGNTVNVYYNRQNFERTGL